MRTNNYGWFNLTIRFRPTLHLRLFAKEGGGRRISEPTPENFQGLYTAR